ncbi:MAG: hypothetical protein M1817_003743 [Caeruleum heppii]|nr:MAG: hypothetical protein M1817_003743 [Caeruleum heppii]
MPPKINVTAPLAPSISSSSTASSALADLDAALRSLEISTNPTKRTPCNCGATRHALLTSAPNCLNCGKIICVKEGLGPCTFCQQPLLSSVEVQAMIRTLKDERGQARMDANNAGQRRADVSRSPRPFAAPKPDSTIAPSKASDDSALEAAERHRNKLLSYQATSAQRTHIIDEAADFETPSAGQSMWATPQERALQLKRQQKLLREQEWSARPEYEKRRAVVSIDLKGGKVVKRMAEVERPSFEEEEEDEQIVEDAETYHPETGSSRGGFGHNPLLGTLIRPTYSTDKGKALETESAPPRIRQKPWRRVQDDNDDNEAVILDGGIYGGPDAGHGILTPAA